MIRPRFVTLCALVAIGLQAAIAAQGGRLCYRASPSAERGGCAAECCELGAGSAGTERLQALLPSLGPSGPIGSDCCIEQQSFAALTGQLSGQADVKPVTAGTGVFAVPARWSLELTRSAPAEQYSARNGLPPPSMRVVRTTVLLI